jgi:hypothetical protein
MEELSFALEEGLDFENDPRRVPVGSQAVAGTAAKTGTDVNVTAESAVLPEVAVDTDLGLTATFQDEAGNTFQSTQAGQTLIDTADPKPESDFTGVDIANSVFSGLEALAGLAQAYTGYKTLGLAEEELAFNKAVTRANLKNQVALTEQDLRDRQRIRNSTNPGISGQALVEQIGLTSQLPA